MEKIIKSQYYNSINDITSENVTDGIHTSIDFDNNSKINLISAKAPKNNYFDLSSSRTISKKQNDKYPNSQLRENDIIISTVGTIGNCAVVTSEILPANADRHVGIIRISNNSKYKVGYVSSFILSKYGRFQTNRFTTGNVQPNLFIYKIKDIIIPFISENFQNKIHILVNKAYALRKKAQDYYFESNEIILKNINYNNIQNTNYSEKAISESFYITGRLDSEYYQPKYDVLFDEIRKHSRKRLGGNDGIVDIRKSIEPGREVYQEDGVPFVRVSDMSEFEITNPSIHLPKDYVDNIEDLYPKKDTILLSKDGSVGIAYKVNETMPIVTSGAILHLTVKNTNEILPAYLTLVLNSQIVKLQAEKDSNGAIIQHWKPSEIENVVIPILDMDIQKGIASKVQKSFALRTKSKQLLKYAKQAVEMAIEQGENVATEWLNEKVKYNGDR